jgi:hypothetical protein
MCHPIEFSLKGPDVEQFLPHTEKLRGGGCQVEAHGTRGQGQDV